jgi:hypothetical protein
VILDDVALKDMITRVLQSGNYGRAPTNMIRSPLRSPSMPVMRPSGGIFGEHARQALPHPP